MKVLHNQSKHNILNEKKNTKLSRSQNKFTAVFVTKKKKEKEHKYSKYIDKIKRIEKFKEDRTGSIIIQARKKNVNTAIFKNFKYLKGARGT